jgi:hypothetical protein
MLYLMSYETGADPNSLGFPSVESCLAVVLQTSNELIGWHSYNTNPDVTASNAATFAVFVNANSTGPAVRLYGATNRVHHKQWKQELRDIAAALGYRGPATSVDLKVGEGTYVQFDRDAARRCCNISYKRNSKMNYTTQETAAALVVQRAIKSGNPVPQPMYGGENNEPVIYTGATVDPAKSSKGQLNKASWSQMDTFTV